MADLTGRDADETKPDIATWGTGNVLETGEGTVKVDLDDKASLSGTTIQTVSANKTDTASLSVPPRPGLTADIPGLTPTIKPLSTKSKVRITGFINIGCDDRFLVGATLFRNGVEIGSGDDAGDRQSVHSCNNEHFTATRMGILVIDFTDTPNTDVLTEYSVRLSSIAGNSGLIRINRSDSDENEDNRTRTVSTINLQEIGG